MNKMCNLDSLSIPACPAQACSHLYVNVIPIIEEHIRKKCMEMGLFDFWQQQIKNSTNLTIK